MKCFRCEKDIAGAGGIKRIDGKLFCRKCFILASAEKEPVIVEPEVEYNLNEFEDEIEPVIDEQFNYYLDDENDEKEW